METIKFVFWEAIRVLGLAFLGLLAAKAVANLKPGHGNSGAARLRWVKGALWLVIAGMAMLGARAVGYDLAAQLYLSASQHDLAQGELSKAYLNALRAVQIRPGSLRYWRTLVITKMAQRQFASVVEDMPAFQVLSGGELDDEDAYDFALCYFYLGRYDEAVSLTRELVGRNRLYAAPYVLQGMAYTAQKKYRDAEASFLGILQTFPNHQAAVEGLAQAFFLEGNRAQAVSVLDQTTKLSFPPDARKRFSALRALYGQ